MTRSSSYRTRRDILSVAAALGLIGLLPRRAYAKANFSAEDMQDLDRISAYWNRLTTVEGKFTQIDQWGQQRDGKIWLQRPGRLRFEYQTPKPDLVILSDGQWLYVQNNALKTTSHYELAQTPLSILVKDKLDLAAEEHVVQVKREPGLVAVTARDDQGLLKGEITLNFSDPAIELRNFISKDVNGVTTQIALRDLKEGVKIDPALFVAENKPQQPGFRKQ